MFKSNFFTMVLGFVYAAYLNTKCLNHMAIPASIIQQIILLFRDIISFLPWSDRHFRN